MNTVTGYKWAGMQVITKQHAYLLFTQKQVEVYKLYEDNTESLVESFEDFQDSHTVFGIELKQSNQPNNTILFKKPTSQVSTSVTEPDEHDELRHAPDAMWTCGCGNYLFFISPTEHICAACGTTQRY